VGLEEGGGMQASGLIYDIWEHPRGETMRVNQQARGGMEVIGLRGGQTELGHRTGFALAPGDGGAWGERGENRGFSKDR